MRDQVLPPPCLEPDPEPELSRVLTRAFSTAEDHRPSSGPTATVNLNGAVTIDTLVLTPRRSAGHGHLVALGQGGVGNARLNAVRLIA